MKEFIIIFISIVAGASGYLLTTFWFQPILRYREIKHRVFSDLIFYANAINAKGMNEIMKEKMEERVDANRKHSAELTACYKDLPSWFRKWLERNGEKPMDAANHLMGLSNTFEYDPADKRIDKIKEHLKILTNVV